MSAKPWSWPVFLGEFCAGFLAVVVACMVLVLFESLVWGTSSIDTKTEAILFAFALVAASIYGYFRGKSAIARWREESQ